MVEWLALVAGVITSITVIGGFTIKMVQKMIIEPMDKRKAERAEKMEKERQVFEQKLLDQVEVNQAPLVESINNLNYLLEDSQRDRVALHKIADENVQRIGVHEERLDNHNDRLIVLETHKGVK